MESARIASIGARLVMILTIPEARREKEFLRTLLVRVSAGVARRRYLALTQRPVRNMGAVGR